MNFIKLLGKLPIFNSNHNALARINTILTLDDYELIFKHYLGGFVKYKIVEKCGFADIYVEKTCKWFFNRRYEKMKNFIEPRCVICITMHYI